MKKYKLYIGMGLVISLSLFSCVSEKKEIAGPFVDVFDFKMEITSKTGGLKKTLINKDGIETSSLNAPNWGTELQPFIEADFNKLANKDNYSKQVLKGRLSPWRDVVWTSLNEKLPVKKAFYRYVDSICIGSYLVVDKSTAAYSMQEELIYLPNSGYSITNQQNLSNINANAFALEGEFVGSRQPWRIFFDIGIQNIPVNFYLTTSEQEMEIEFFQGKESLSLIHISEPTRPY